MQNTESDIFAKQLIAVNNLQYSITDYEKYFSGYRMLY